MRQIILKISVLIAATIAAGLCFSFQTEHTAGDQDRLYEQFYQCDVSVAALDQVAEDYRFGKTGLTQLQQALAKVRLDYKRIEFFLAFRYSEYIAEHINGAPLLHIERTGTTAVVLEPEGLQVLDEMVFSSEAEAQKPAILMLSKKLHNSFSQLFRSFDPDQAATQKQLTAMRLELVRIYAMGITGFDTPGSLNALPEAAASLEGMRYFFATAYADHEQSGKVLRFFDASLSMLQKAESFEKFDRLEFLKQGIDPLYKALGDMETKALPEALFKTTSWNPGSTSLFADDFLDAYFFTQLKKGQDSPALRDLGKQLFFDKNLSNDGRMSCATCHEPEKAFADGVPKSLSSIQGKTVLRNAPSLINAVYADRYFYDLRAFTLEQQAEHVFFSKDEFNTGYDAILRKLNSDKMYAQQFAKVFGKGTITRDRFSKALASYVMSLRSFNSVFDQYVRGEKKELDPEIKNGFNLFMGKANCATCHFAPTFSGLVPPLYRENESEILGVLADPRARPVSVDNDEGRYANRISSEKAWIYEKSFKTTTVRNAELTAPYFHNGAYQTLEEVIDFYNKGGGQGMGLAVANQTLAPDPLDLSEKEQKELIAFIRSLNNPVP